MEHHEIFPMDRADLERLLESGNEKAIIDAPLSAKLSRSRLEVDSNDVPSISGSSWDGRALEMPQLVLGTSPESTATLMSKSWVPKLMSLQADASCCT